MYVRVERTLGLIVLLSAVAAAGGEVPADGTPSAKTDGPPSASVALPEEGTPPTAINPVESAAQAPASADAVAGARAGEPGQESDTDSTPGGSPARGDGPEIIVSAPGPLLKEVEAVVEELDQRAATQNDQHVIVVTLKRANPKLVEESLKSLPQH